MLVHLLLRGAANLLYVVAVHLFLVGYLTFQICVVLGELFYLFVELVNVLVEEEILLLVFEEGVGDLLQVGNPALQLNLFKALPD